MTDILDDMQENVGNLQIEQGTNGKNDVENENVELVTEKDIEVQTSPEENTTKEDTVANDEVANDEDANDDAANEEEKIKEEAFKVIDSVSDEMKEVAVRISRFCGPKTHNEYLYLDEILIRATVRLDNLETHGIDIIRQNRKKMIQYIQYLQGELDKRVVSDSSDSSNSST